MKNFQLIVVSLLGIIFTSCGEKDEPASQYFANMYYTVPYDTYGEYEIFENEQEAKKPVEGTIKQGWMPYEYEDNTEGYEAAKENLTNDLAYTENNIEEGKELYNIYCATCHSEKGDGKGYLVEREKILGVPSYDDKGRAITEGSVYHVMYYGINTMGSYASQMNTKELWQVDMYVMKLKRDLEGVEQPEFEKK